MRESRIRKAWFQDRVPRAALETVSNIYRAANCTVTVLNENSQGYLTLHVVQL